VFDEQNGRRKFVRPKLGLAADLSSGLFSFDFGDGHAMVVGKKWRSVKFRCFKSGANPLANPSSRIKPQESLKPSGWRTSLTIWRIVGRHRWIRTVKDAAAIGNETKP